VIKRKDRLRLVRAPSVSGTFFASFTVFDLQILFADVSFMSIPRCSRRNVIPTVAAGVAAKNEDRPDHVSSYICLVACATFTFYKYDSL
jgi:hypothetical protein